MPEARGPSDADLMTALAAGEESALGTAYDRYGGFVHGLALRILRDPHAAEEVLQDVFLRLWRTASRLDRTRGSLAGFLAVVTRNRALDRVRSRRGSPASMSLDEHALAHGSPMPPEAASLAEMGRRATAALAGLPSEERAVLDLAYFEGLTQSEIADRTGAPLGTVKGRMRNGLRRLRDVLIGTGGGS